MTRVLVLIPTYNESENIVAAVASVRRAVPLADVWVLDDASPDGTGGIAEKIAESDPQVYVVHRTSKDGLGAAYLDGFARGLNAGYDVFVEFDADGSHPAEVISMLVDAVSAPSVGLAIGSRWVPGGSVVNWPKRREVLSRSGNAYARLMLGLNVRDSTAGFRAYTRECLGSIDLSNVKTRGYGFQVDMTRLAASAGYRISEIPIAFRERKFGESKMSGAIVFEAMRMVTFLGLTRWIKSLR